MSRIGKKPIELPTGVTVEDLNGNVVVSGPLGKLSREIDTRIGFEKENNHVTLTCPEAENISELNAKYGLYRALIYNMVEGVSKGYSKKLVFKGIGYRLTKQGNKLVMNIGYSKPAELVEPEGIKLTILEADTLEVSGIDKEKVGLVASQIRALKPVEPYHNYGIHYSDEHLIKKEGKKAGKK